MPSIEDALRKIAEQTGSHCVSVSITLEATKRYTVFLHGANAGTCRHGMGPSLDKAVEAAITDGLYARAS